MDNNLHEAFCKQINKELESAYLYLDISTYFSEINMDGFAKTVMNQAYEELDHAKRIYEFLLSKDLKVKLYAINAPENEFHDPINTIKEVLLHEKYITQSINELYKMALDKEDYSSQVFLQWFIKEQVEEEDKFRTLLQKMENVQNYECDINRIDRHLEYNEGDS